MKQDSGSDQVPPIEQPVAPDPRQLAVLHRLDPGHEADHHRVLRVYNSQTAQCCFVRELLVEALFFRRRFTEEAQRATQELMAIERDDVMA